MTVGLEGPAPYSGPVPEDSTPMTLAEYLRGALALIAQDRVLAPDEMQEIQLFMAGVQEIGRQRAAATAQQVQPGQGLLQSGTEEPFDQAQGTEPVNDMTSGEEPY